MPRSIDYHARQKLVTAAIRAETRLINLYDCRRRGDHLIAIAPSRNNLHRFAVLQAASAAGECDLIGRYGPTSGKSALDHYLSMVEDCEDAGLLLPVERRKNPISPPQRRAADNQYPLQRRQNDRLPSKQSADLTMNYRIAAAQRAQQDAIDMLQRLMAKMTPLIMPGGCEA